MSLQTRESMKDQFMFRHTTAHLLAVALVLLLVTSSAHAQIPNASDGDWPWWRGPEFNGIASAATDVPTEWSDTKNVVWKVPVAGRGHSSPTIVGDRIFLATANEEQQIQGVLAFNKTTGRELWQTEISRGGFPRTHSKNTHATCTLACDGERLFVSFHHHNKLTLAALNLSGKKLWAKDVGPFNPRIYEYGYAPSPVFYGDNVIVAADYEKGGHLSAYDRKSGRQQWQVPRPRKLSFSSPVIANVAGRDQLLISGCEVVASYNPTNGKQLWSVPGTTMATCGTMIWMEDLVFASGGYPKPETICVRADGSNQVVWKNREKCYEQSMLIHDGYIYALTDKGVAYCWEAKSGREMWRKRLSAPVSASPVLAGGHIYQSVENGTTYVFKPNPKAFDLVARNKLGNEAFATPSFSKNRIYLRIAKDERGKRQEYLYCLGK